MKNKKQFTRLKKYLPLIFIIGIFIVLCSFTINRAVWFDESYSAQTIKGTFGEIAETTAADVHPPLYYYLLKLWAIPFGRKIISLRSASVFFGAIAVVFAYLIFRRWSKSNKIATFLTLSFAICPYFIYYATEIRMYSLVCAIIMASVYFLDLALEKKSKKYWVVYTLLFTMALYTHYFSAFAFLAEYVYIFFRHHKENPKLIKNLIVVAFSAFILYIPWIPSLLSQVVAVEKDYWISPVTPLRFLSFFSESLIRYEDISNNIPGLILTLLTLAVFVAIVLSTYGMMNKNAKDKTLLIACLVFVPLITLFILSVPPFSPVYISRYVTCSVALFWVLIAIFIVHAGRIKPSLTMVLLILLSLCLFNGYVNLYKENEYSAECEQIISKIEKYDEESDEKIPVVYAKMAADAFDMVYYQTEKHHVYIIDPMTTWYASKPLTKYGENYIESFVKFKDEHDVIWYVSSKAESDSATMKNAFVKYGYEIKHVMYVGDNKILRLEKEKDLKTTENLL